MPDEAVFVPAKRTGILFHIAAFLIFLVLAFFSLRMVIQAFTSSNFLLYLVPLLLSVGVLAALTYQFFTIYSAYYSIDRDAIQLHWGFRFERILINDILWIQAAPELSPPISLPKIHIPGYISGSHRLPDNRTIEIMATNHIDLIFIATINRVLAVSPSNPKAFLNTYLRFLELGSFSQEGSQSVYPNYLLAWVRRQVWSDIPARVLITTNLLLNIGLIIGISMMIQSREAIHLGFQANGNPGEFVPANQLILLPIINSSFIIFDLLLGLYFFRNNGAKPLSYLLWAASIFTSFLFIISLVLIGSTS